MFTYIEEDGDIVAILDSLHKQQITEKRYNILLKQSDIPKFYHNIEFKDYEGNMETDEFKKIVYYANNCHKPEFDAVSLYLYGVNNTQKTALACNILKGAMRKGIRTKFILAGNLIDKLMKIQGFSDNKQLYNEVQELKQYDMLLIDDIFDVNKSLMWKNLESRNMIISEWDTFLRDVLSKNIKLILTSNYGMESIEKTWGLSIFELIDRNFVPMQLIASIKNTRKTDVREAFRNLYKEESC